MSTQLEPFVNLKQAIATNLFPFSYSHLRQLAERGIVPAYSLPGKGSRKNWVVKISELYDWFSKSRGGVRGKAPLQERTKKVAGRLQGRWV